jgi:Uma2 family endonuclease
MDLSEVGGLEPDYSFYINNWQLVMGKDRLDWTRDPPPDLAVEIDVTHYTDINDYLPYKVPEVWIYKRKKLMIYNLEGNHYNLVSGSRYFSNLDVSVIVAESLELARQRSSSVAMGILRRRFPRSSNL